MPPALMSSTRNSSSQGSSSGSPGIGSLQVGDWGDGGFQPVELAALQVVEVHRERGPKGDPAAPVESLDPFDPEAQPDVVELRKAEQVAGLFCGVLEASSWLPSSRIQS